MLRPRRSRTVITLLATLALLVLAAPEAVAFCNRTLVCRHKGDVKSCRFVTRCDYTFKRIPRCTWVRRCYKRYYCAGASRWGSRWCGYRTYCKRYKSCM
ncbi:MAG: hypothetical protein KC503_00250 [Myxococcales bacterium]|nr:hypothetical protein [Myxococcales bacterium]